MWIRKITDRWGGTNTPATAYNSVDNRKDTEWRERNLIKAQNALAKAKEKDARRVKKRLTHPWALFVSDAPEPASSGYHHVKPIRLKTEKQLVARYMYLRLQGKCAAGYAAFWHGGEWIDVDLDELLKKYEKENRREQKQRASR